MKSYQLALAFCACLLMGCQSIRHPAFVEVDPLPQYDVSDRDYEEVETKSNWFRNLVGRRPSEQIADAEEDIRLID